MCNIYIIGVGGVGSWLAPSIVNLAGRENAITLIDGDHLEAKNLDRQLFSEKDIGNNKALVLAERYGCKSMADWFSTDMIDFMEEDWILACVDNHKARLAVLKECDRCGCRAIFAANETSSAEAYLYQTPWQNTPLDPRIMYPEILTDDRNDPRVLHIGCTGEVQKDNPQLVTSNSMAASLAGHLFALWQLHAPKLKQSTLDKLPHHFVANMSALVSHRVCDTKQTTTERTDNADYRDREVAAHA